MPLSHVQAGETILYSNCPKILTWFRACLPAYVPPTAASISNGRPQVLRHWYYIIHPSRPPRLDDGEQRSDRYLLRIQTQHAPSSLSSLSTEQCISPARVVAEAGTSTVGRHQKSHKEGTCLGARLSSDPELIMLSAVGHSEHSPSFPLPVFCFPPREDASEGRCYLGHWSSSFLNTSRYLPNAACLPYFRFNVIVLPEAVQP